MLTRLAKTCEIRTRLYLVGQRRVYALGASPYSATPPASVSASVREEHSAIIQDDVLKDIAQRRRHRQCGLQILGTVYRMYAVDNELWGTGSDAWCVQEKKLAPPENCPVH